MRIRRILATGVIVLATLGVAARPNPTAHAADPAASRFVPVAPCRLADTRDGTGYTRLDATTIRVLAAGRCNIDPSAVAVAVTAVSDGATLPGFLTVYPAGTTRPLASTLNYRPGEIRSNAAITKVSSGASVDVFTTSGAVVLDVTGWFAPATSATAGRFVPLTPARLLDTRTSTKVPVGGEVTVPIPAGVPADAGALALNVTVTRSTNPGFVTVYPAGTTRPGSSSLNLDRANQTRAGSGIHPTSAAGVTVFLSGGGDVIVDITGYVTGAGATASNGGLFVPVAPTRLLDTRSDDGTAPRVTSARLAVDPTAAAAVLNVTSTEGDPSFVTAYPAGTTRPFVSTLNPEGGGDVVANLALVPTTDAGIDLFATAPTHLVVDLAGWFTKATGSGGPTPTTTTVPHTPVLYLTFDDGPEDIYTQQLLDVLAKYRVKATFFVLGASVHARPELLRKEVAAGHAIGNHTWSHIWFGEHTYDEIRDELVRTNAEIKAVLGRTPTCMRPPFGAETADSKRATADLRLDVINWTIATGDGGPDAMTTQQLLDALGTVRDGDVVNMHDGGGFRTNLAAAMDQWLAANVGKWDFRVLPTCTLV